MLQRIPSNQAVKLTQRTRNLLTEICDLEMSGQVTYVNPPK